MSFFFFNDTPTPEIYTLSLHDALPILNQSLTNVPSILSHFSSSNASGTGLRSKSGSAGMPRPISYAVFCLKKKKDMSLQILECRNQTTGAAPSRQSGYHYSACRFAHNI